LLLAIDQPQASMGEVFNCGDDEKLTIRQVVEIITDELDHRWELLSMPAEFAIPARPLMMNYRTTHRVMDTTKLRTLLGYRDVVPAREAVRRAASTPEGRDVALARGVTSRELDRALRGDLDTIVLCALKKEPERRYPSIDGFAADLRRHLEHHPVSARRDTLAYRAAKLVRRHALAAGLSAACLLSLVAGGVAVAWQAKRAGEERDRATESATEQPASPKRTLGSLRGLLHVPEDFDEPLPDELQRAFEGEAGE